MKLEPLADRILIEPLEDTENKSAGGIIIPDTAKEKPLQGVVISAGPGKKDNDGKIIPMEIKEGDRVLHDKYSGTEVKLDGKKYLLIRESDVLALVK